MIIGSPKFVTDEQWLELLKIVNGEETIALAFPTEEGGELVLEHKYVRYVITNNGKKSSSRSMLGKL